MITGGLQIIEHYSSISLSHSQYYPCIRQQLTCPILHTYLTAHTATTPRPSPRLLHTVTEGKSLWHLIWEHEVMRNVHILGIRFTIWPLHVVRCWSGGGGKKRKCPEVATYSPIYVLISGMADFTGNICILHTLHCTGHNSECAVSNGLFYWLSSVEDSNLYCMFQVVSLPHTHK